MQVELTPRAEAAMGNFSMRVPPEHILETHFIIMREVNRLRLSLQKFKRDYGEGMPLLGNGHPVSKPFKDSFDASTTKLVAICETDINSLADVGDGLADAARAYGKAEDEITASLKRAKSIPYKPVPIPGAVPPALRALTDPRSVDSPPSTMSGLFSGGTR